MDPPFKKWQKTTFKPVEIKKMKIKITLLVACVFMVSGCGNRKASHNTSDAINDSITFSKDPYALHFEEELSKERPSEFVLNDLVQKTTFIPLDSKEESPLLADFNFSVHAIDDQFIVSSGVMDKALPALLYDSSGRFIKPLIRRGRGPYEITGAVPMPSLNRSSNVLSVFGGQKIVSYSLVEEKAKDMRVDRYILSGVLLDDGNYVAISGAYRFNEEDPYLYFFDPEGKLLKSLNYPAGTKKAYQLKEGESSGPTDKYILSNNHLDQALFHDLFNDTVYRISGLDRMDPYIVLNRKNLLPMHKDVNNPEARGRTIHIHRLAETRDYFFISISCFLRFTFFVKNYKLSCRCTKAKLPDVLKPGEESEIIIEIDTTDKLGKSVTTVLFETNTTQKDYVIRIDMNIIP